MPFGSLVYASPAIGTSATCPSITTPISNPLILVHIALAHASAVVNSLMITGFGGTATQVASIRTTVAPQSFLSVWAIAGVTPNTSGTVRANFSASAPFNMAVETWSGTDSANPCPPVDARTSNTTGTVTLSPGNMKTGDFCAGSVANALWQDVRPVSPTNRYIQNSTAINLAVGDGTGSVTLGGTGNLATSKIVVPIKAVPPPPPPPPGVAVNVTVTNAAGLSATLTAFAITELINPPGLPAGVSLQAIDGELMTDAITMTNDYYERNGFTYAANKGWDSLFPFGLWLAPMTSQSDADRWNDIGLTHAVGATGDSLFSLFLNNGIEYIPVPGDMGVGTIGAESVGLLASDEGNPWPNMENTPNSIQDNRFWYNNVTHNPIIYGDIGGVPMATVYSSLRTTPNATQRHMDIGSYDIYWFNSVGTSQGNNQLELQTDGAIYGLERALTQDEGNRPCRYGDMINFMRPWQEDHYPAPIGAYVENGGAYGEDTTAAAYIRPPEMNAAIWSVIIHGGRYIHFFNHSFAGPATSADNFNTAYYKTIQSGETISIYDQAKATIAAVNALTPVILSPFAVGYATVSPEGWKWGDGTSFVSLFSGFDIMTKWYNDKFYIFAQPRWSQTLSNQNATFTIVNTGATQVTVINESRTINITNGGTQFTDTFANALTVHIYRID